MLEPNTDESSPHEKREHQTIVFRNSPQILALPPRTRRALWDLQKLLQDYSRVPIFALAGPSGEALEEAAQALCDAGGGSYIRLSEDIGKKIAKNRDFRIEWIDASYLAQRVLELANNCSVSFLAVDGWEIILGMMQHINPKTPLEVLDMLMYRSPQKPIVLILPLGRGGFGNLAEVRGVMDASGYPRVIDIIDESQQQAQ